MTVKHGEFFDVLFFHLGDEGFAVIEEGTGIDMGTDSFYQIVFSIYGVDFGEVIDDVCS